MNPQSSSAQLRAAVDGYPWEIEDDDDATAALTLAYALRDLLESLDLGDTLDDADLFGDIYSLLDTLEDAAHSASYDDTDPDMLDEANNALQELREVVYDLAGRLEREGG